MNMNANKTVTATFTEDAAPPAQWTLTVLKSGTGTGTGTGTGIDCGADCSEAYADGTQVTLTATAAGGSSFGGWSNCDSASGNQCTMTMGAEKTVSANFTTTGGGGPNPPAEQCAVPNLKGMTLAQAESALTAAHCTLGKVKKKKVKKGKSGVVLSQSPAAGQTLAAGAIVDVTVSKKKKKRK